MAEKILAIYNQTGYPITREKLPMPDTALTELPTGQSVKPVAQRPHDPDAKRRQPQPETQQARVREQKTQQSGYTPAQKEAIAKLGELLRELSKDPTTRAQLEEQLKSMQKMPSEVSEEDIQKAAEIVQEKKEEAKGVELKGQRDEERRRIPPLTFDGLQPIQPTTSELTALQDIRQRASQDAPQHIGDSTWLQGIYSEIFQVERQIGEKLDTVGRQIRELLKKRDFENMDLNQFQRNYTELKNQQDELEKQRRVAASHREHAADYGRQIQLERRGIGEQILEEFNRIQNAEERSQYIRALAQRITVEDQIDPRVLTIIAKNEEASEIFWDKIISKPFSQPNVRYSESLGFYANSVNKLAFFDAVGAVDTQRRARYGHMSEASDRLHEMNRTILSESGNPEAFMTLARSITHENLQAGTELDGVEAVRHLYDLAYGRLYSKIERLEGSDYQPEIEEWVERQFRRMARSGIIKSRYKINDAERNLEEWEIIRALAFGRNLTTAFYRQSELISWSKIPEQWQRWIESVPTETVVRAMAGFKWMIYRFRIGGMSGREFTIRLRKKIMDKYDQKNGLHKIGKLNIAEELYPTWHFKGAGFDKGWRPFQAYWRSDRARIDLSRLSPQQQAKYQRVIERFGYRPTMGDFLIEQEYLQGVAASVQMKFDGQELPDEYKEFVSKEQQKLLEEDLTQVLDRDGRSILDQFNLNLGTLIAWAGTNENMKTRLWKKAAEFLPLRLAYFLSEEGVVMDGRGNVIRRNGGVRELLKDGRFQHLAGEAHNLFNEEFETKLLMLQRERIQRQLVEQERAFRMGEAPRGMALNLEFTIDGADVLTDVEKEFVRRLQKLGKENARALARIAFHHVPFLDDTTFQHADYSKVRGETFPRRQGSDFASFANINSEMIGLVANLEGISYEKVIEQLVKIRDLMSTPEDKPTGQDVVAPILETYLQMAKQWGWTKFPFVKTILSLFGQPTSSLEKHGSPDSPSYDESALNARVREAAGQGVIRRLKKPDEKKSQVDQILENVKAKWYNVMQRELRNIVVVFGLIAMFDMFRRLAQRDKS